MPTASMPRRPPRIYPELEGDNTSRSKPPKPSDLRRPCVDGPFFPIPCGKLSGITRSIIEAQWAITGVICGSPLIECATWGSALWIYTQAYDRGEASVLTGVTSGLETLKPKDDVKVESDSEGQLDDDNIDCDGSSYGSDCVDVGSGMEGDDDDDDSRSVDDQDVFFGPPDPHPQYVVVTTDSLCCVCGCKRTVESVQAEKRARKRQRRDARDEAIIAATIAFYEIPPTPVHVTISLAIHLPAGVAPENMTIAPVMHFPSDFRPSDAPINVTVSPIIEHAHAPMAPIHLTMAPIVHIPSRSPPVPITLLVAPVIENAPAPPSPTSQSGWSPVINPVPGWPGLDASKAGWPGVPPIPGWGGWPMPVVPSPPTPVPVVPSPSTHAPPNGDVPLWGTISGWPEDDLEPFVL